MRKVKPKIGTKTPPFNEDTKHRAKVIARKREVIKMQNDIENSDLIEKYGYHNDAHMSQSIKGRYREERESRIKYKKMVWRALWIIIIIVVLFCFLNQ